MNRPLEFVCCGPVTVLVGLVQRDGVAVLADRASIRVGRELMPGVPDPAEDVTKVFTNPSGTLLLGIAGKASTPARDLLHVLSGVVAAAEDFYGLLGDTTRVLNGVARDFQEHAGLGTAVVVPPFSQPVHTVVLIGGPTPSGPQLVALAVGESGAAQLHDLPESVIYAPTSVRAEAGLMLLNISPDAPVTEAVDGWVDRLAQLSVGALVGERLVITPDHDYAYVTGAGASGVRRVDAPPDLRRGLPRH